MFNFDRAFFQDHTTRLICSAKRSLQDRQRDVYDSHRHRVFAIAYYMIGNEIDAEEALKQTFVRAFNILQEPDSKVIDAALMEELRGHLLFDDPVFPMEVSVGDTVGGRNIRRTDLEEAIGGLPPLERLVFLLKDVEGYSTEQISEFANVPTPGVPAILMSARLRLRSVLAGRVANAPGIASDKPSAASQAA